MERKCVNIHMKTQNNYSSNIYKHILIFPLTYPNKRQCTFRIKNHQEIGSRITPIYPNILKVRDNKPTADIFNSENLNVFLQDLK